MQVFASMNYFKPHYGDIRWPIKQDGMPGMRPQQLGAMHAIAAHFTRHTTPAIITMPTGSGKTAVISATPFLLRADRVLILTPSRMVREQITEEFRGLLDLRRLGVIDSRIPTPAVYSVSNKISDLDDWLNLRPYDVVIGTPNSISPELSNVSEPPADFFDLVLVDEAHHSAARSWKGLLERHASARQVLFTATPFRRDRRELVGKLVYVYELRDAYRDGVFGQLEYRPVAAANGNIDLEIARSAAAQHKADQAAGLAHMVMVRTGTKSRAKELLNLYAENTDLNLQLITGDHSLGRLKTTIQKLRDGQLDGLVCVDMLGEGFDLPNLKIAALHTPHKSLAVTLQFIGRFARTNAPNLGRAVFFAAESDMEIERQRLYDQGAAWEEIIPNLSSVKVREEEEVREVLYTFEAAEESSDDAPDLSLYSLRPYHHLKILQSRQPIDVSQEIQAPAGFTIVHRHVSPDENTAVYVMQCRARPDWTSVDHLDSVSHELVVIFFHEQTGLLFVCSSLRTQGFYEHVAEQFGDPAPLRGLSFKAVNRVLLDLQDLRLFNLGMRNASATRRSESYRTLAGPGVADTVEESDKRRFRRGHWFGSASDSGEEITIGLSAASKVWSNKSSQIPKLINWCKRLATKIATQRVPMTNSGLDHLPVGEEVVRIPDGLTSVDWNEVAYLSPPMAIYTKADGTEIECQLLDFDAVLNRNNADEQSISLQLVGKDVEQSLTFQLDQDPLFFRCEGPEMISVVDEDGFVGIATYLNRHLPTFFTANCGSLEGRNYFDPPNMNLPPFSALRVENVDWKEAGVNIEVEVANPEPDPSSIHGYLRNRLLAEGASLILYDHGSGELADFVTFQVRPDDVLVTLFHCKGSCEPIAGERVEDLYEICGQAIKSARWVDPKLMLNGLNRGYARGSSFLRGTIEEARALLSGQLPVSLQIVLVQPGLSRARFTHRGGNLLAAVDDYVYGGRCTRIRVLGSA
jgi:superfamily II DNA or RNA helicase